MNAPADAVEAQLAMVHTLPDARYVHRIEYLAERAVGKRVIHVGFVDAGFQEMQEATGTWLHAHLDEGAAELVGIDIDEAGVEAAVAAGYAGHVADCRDPEAVAALDLEPADVVIAGEIIEHLDDPGSFLSLLHELVRPGGELVLTTPNASGLVNGFAAMAGAEVNHPDHVVLFSWRTLTNLASRHGWAHVETATFVPAFKGAPAKGLKMRIMRLGGQAVLALERLLARLGMPFTADGMIVVSRSIDSPS
ncbi:MAG: class I SAM-dependent methyltransferase [Actinomycetota bacterium]